MITECPHCSITLQLTSAQIEKINAALANLKPGTTLKLGCPHCKKPIALQADGSLFEERPAEGAAETKAPPVKKPTVAPPGFPDISWLAQGIYAEKEVVVADVPKALVLMAGGPGREAVGKAFSERGYQVEMPESEEDALIQMRFGIFAAVVVHTSKVGDIADSALHQTVSSLRMEKRRGLFYAVIGKEFHTLYNLEALAYSANVVVNEAEAVHFDIILKKGLQEMQELFGPYVEARKRVGGHA